MMRALLGWWFGSVDETMCAALTIAVAGLALSLAGPHGCAAQDVEVERKWSRSDYRVPGTPFPRVLRK